MATDGPTPPGCNSEIYKHGRSVCLVDGCSNAVEMWVKKVAVLANTRVDWHYVGGRANVLHLGDPESRQRVLHAVKTLRGQLGGRILSLDEDKQEEAL